MALLISITKGDPEPNGDNAQLSKTADGGKARTAQWLAMDQTYTITLPGAVWEGGDLTFKVHPGKKSAEYTVKSGAPTGPSEYEINPASTAGGGPPEVVIDP